MQKQMGFQRVSIQKRWITALAKAAAMSPPQAVWDTVRDGDERERRTGP